MRPCPAFQYYCLSMRAVRGANSTVLDNETRQVGRGEGPSPPPAGAVSGALAGPLGTTAVVTLDARRPRRRTTGLLLCAALTFNLCLAAGYVGLWLMLGAQGEFWRADFTG